MVAEGDKVAAYLRAFFKKRSNERVMQFDMAVFYTLRDGRISQLREIIDSFDLVQQVLERDFSAHPGAGASRTRHNLARFVIPERRTAAIRNSRFRVRALRAPE